MIKEYEEILISLRQSGMSYRSISVYLYKEYNIKVSHQAVHKFINSRLDNNDSGDCCELEDYISTEMNLQLSTKEVRGLLGKNSNKLEDTHKLLDDCIGNIYYSKNAMVAYNKLKELNYDISYYRVAKLKNMINIQSLCSEKRG